MKQLQPVQLFRIHDIIEMRDLLVLNLEENSTHGFFVKIADKGGLTVDLNDTRDYANGQAAQCTQVATRDLIGSIDRHQDSFQCGVAAAIAHRYTIIAQQAE